MTALSNIPPQAVLPLGAYDLQDLERAAARAGQTLLHVDCVDVMDKPGVMGRLGTGLKLPCHFGRNLDALYDCLTDLKPADNGDDKPGFVLILQNLPDGPAYGAEDRNSLLDVFREAADYFYDEDTAFRVFYSINKAR